MLSDPSATTMNDLCEEMVRVRRAIGGLAGTMKSEAPIVNVPAPVVNVPAPVVNIPKMEMPERKAWCGTIEIERDGEGRLARLICTPK